MTKKANPRVAAPSGTKASTPTEVPVPVDRVWVIGSNQIMVNLGAPPRLPDSPSFRIYENSGTDTWAKVERRPEGLYADDKKIVLYPDVAIEGYKLQRRLSETGVESVHQNIIDAACIAGFMPDDFIGRNGFTSFAVTFASADPDDGLAASYWEFDPKITKWRTGYCWLDGIFGLTPVLVFE